MEKELIKEIREKCIKANPEIVELKFGCIIQIKGSKPTVLDNKTPIVLKGNKFEEKGLYFNLAKNKFYQKHKMFGGDLEVKIIGRPIRLADVLLAMPVRFYVKSGNGYFLDSRKADLPSCQECFWDLEDDNLEHQSEETLTFLKTILTTK